MRMDLSMGGGGTGGCGSSAAFVSSTISLSPGGVVGILVGSKAGAGTGAGAGEGAGAERYPAVRGSLLVMVTMETAGITGGEKSG